MKENVDGKAFGTAQARTVPKLMVSLLLFVSLTYVVYTLKLAASSLPSSSCKEEEDTFPSATTARQLVSVDSSEVSVAVEGEFSGLGVTEPARTGIRHVVFGIAASAKLWEQRKNYIKLWLVWFIFSLKKEVDFSEFNLIKLFFTFQTELDFGFVLINCIEYSKIYEVKDFN